MHGVDKAELGRTPGSLQSRCGACAGPYTDRMQCAAVHCMAAVAVHLSRQGVTHRAQGLGLRVWDLCSSKFPVPSVPKRPLRRSKGG